MTWRRRFLSGALATLTVVAIGVAGFTAAGAEGRPTAASDTTTEVTVDLMEGNIILSKNPVPSGTIIFTVRNIGKQVHEFVIRGEGTDELDPGETATLTIDLAFGEYSYWSDVGDDEKDGMWGSLTVTPPADTSTTTTTTTTTTPPATTVTPPPAPAPVQTVRVSETDSKITLKGTSTVKVKEKGVVKVRQAVKHGVVRFVVTNNGKLRHDFVIAGLRTPSLAPGQRSTRSVTLRKGVYAYKCSVPGHASAGMTGVLVVR
jgi:uncharacterized cupredoxin-like copper-binding protein